MTTKNNNIIIFDFMRTLYDPETATLFTDTREILEKLSQNFILVLVSRREGNRDSLVTELDISKYFKKIYLVETKDDSVFKEIEQDTFPNHQTSYVIGDRIQDEIYLGNKFNYKTIWLQQGKFKDHLPTSATHKPWRTIHNLKEILAIITPLLS